MQITNGYLQSHLSVSALQQYQLTLIHAQREVIRPKTNTIFVIALGRYNEPSICKQQYYW